jgi:hypothetical protein
VWESARVFTIKRAERAARPPRSALQLQNCDRGSKRSVDVFAQEGEFAPTQYSNPRLLSVTVKFSY